MATLKAVAKLFAVPHRRSRGLSRNPSRAIGFAALLCLMASPAPVAAGSVLSGLVGTWSGGAEVQLEGGKVEQMRCKGYYTGQGGDGLGLAIRCANASAKIDLRATLTAAGNQVSGSWEERTYNASGVVTGRATADRVELSIQGGGLNATMSVAVQGATHTVAIKSDGTGLKAIKMSMNRN